MEKRNYTSFVPTPNRLEAKGKKKVWMQRAGKKKNGNSTLARTIYPNKTQT